MEEEYKSPYKDNFPSADLVRDILRRDRAVRLRWRQHPEEMPENIKSALRVARALNRRVIAQVRADLNAKK